MVKKIIVFILLQILFSAFIKTNVAAQENFTVDSNTEYKIHDTGLTTVTNTITIRNNTSQTYSKSYLFNLTGIRPKNLKASEEGNPIPVFSQQDGNTLTLRFEFPNAVVGKDSTRTFVVTYEEDSFAEKTGEVWEVSIPRLGINESFRQYTVSLSVPDSFGDEAYISPEPREVRKESGYRMYSYKKDDIKRTGITAGFGKFQVFSFTLQYHLENKENTGKDFDIAIPPDTSLQKMFYFDISPQPINVTPDGDGNWIAKYTLSPREQVEVKVKGYVQIFGKPRKLLTPSPSTFLTNMKPTNFWQSDDSQIRELSKSLKTPDAIYEYVSKNLSYNYERVRPDSVRMGAKSALANPTDAICMEFTDLFIALARASGIPAREINGYAYSENPKIQPLSLVADVLHAWPEFWSSSEEAWIPVDPTWGSTSGVDYFNKLDLRHFAFVIHGKDPEKPLSPGSYKSGDNPQKDIFVAIGQIPEDKVSNVEIQVSNPKKIEFFKNTVTMTVINKGTSAIYDITPQILFDGNINFSTYINVLPPYAQYQKTFEIPLGLIGSNAPESVKVSAYRKELDVPTNKNKAIIYQILVLTLILFTFLLLIHINTLRKKINIYAAKNREKDNNKRTS